MAESYDTIVIGVGGMGSAVLFHLARRGHRVLGLEQRSLGHDRGSSHGESRIIRRAYFEHPDYVPLVERSEALWEELEAICGEPLMQRVGLFIAGPLGGDVIQGVRTAARQHPLSIESMGPREARERFPGFGFDDDMEILFEPEAGYLRVEACVMAYAEAALDAGATVMEAATVTNIRKSGSGFDVETARGQFHSQTLVLCAGAWTNRLVKSRPLPIDVQRRVQIWLAPRASYRTTTQTWPVFAFDVDHRFIYGFPANPYGLVKVAEHTGEDAVDDPDTLDRGLRPEDGRGLEAFIHRYVPALGTAVINHSVCMYSKTPDCHGIVDRHPEIKGLFLCAGFSGHGFKFAPVFGSAMADLVMNGRTAEPIGFLSSRRPSLKWL